MEDLQLFKQMDFIRMRTIAALDNTTEEMADIVPPGLKIQFDGTWDISTFLMKISSTLSLGRKEIFPKVSRSCSALTQVLINGKQMLLPCPN